MEQHPGWDILQKRVEQRIADKAGSITQRMLAEEEPDVDLRFEAGWRAGARFVLRQPERAKGQHKEGEQ